MNQEDPVSVDEALEARLEAHSGENWPGLEAVGEYRARYRRTGVPDLEVSEPYDLFPSKPRSGAFTIRGAWPDNYPFAERAGVYMLYSEARELVYVGKASMNSCIGKRLYTYFHYVADQECILRHSTWAQIPRFLIVIAVPQDMPFEASALEEYLIARLNPLSNVMGMGRFMS